MLDNHLRYRYDVQSPASDIILGTLPPPMLFHSDILNRSCFQPRFRLLIDGQGRLNVNLLHHVVRTLRKISATTDAAIEEEESVMERERQGK
jgi:hypothetical protein